MRQLPINAWLSEITCQAEIKNMNQKLETYLKQLSSVYHLRMITVQADDLVTMTVSRCWIPEQLNGRICHHTLPHSGGRSQTYE